MFFVRMILFFYGEKYVTDFLLTVNSGSRAEADQAIRTELKTRAPHTMASCLDTFLDFDQ